MGYQSKSGGRRVSGWQDRDHGDFATGDAYNRSERRRGNGDVQSGALD